MRSFCLIGIFTSHKELLNMLSNDRTKWRWVMFISGIFLVGTFAGICIKTYTDGTDTFVGIYYSNWVIILQLMIVISAMFYDRKKRTRYVI